MGWQVVRKGVGGLTNGLEFPLNLGDSTQVSSWGKTPQAELDAGTDYISRAYWDLGNQPYNHWIPYSAEISTITLMATPYRTWVDAIVILCDKDNDVYLVLKTYRDGQDGESLINFRSILYKRTVSNGQNIDTQISGENTLALYNGAGHIESMGSAFFYFGTFTYGSNTFYGIGMCFDEKYDYWGTQFTFTNGAMFASERSIFWNKIGTTEPSGKLESPEFGPASQPDGGYIPTNPHGTFDFTSDEIPISPKPTLGVTSAGFINVYKIGLNELQDLGEKLFPHFLPAEILDNPANLTTPEMLAVFLKTLYGALISPVGTSIAVADNLGIVDILMNGKLIDYILDCHIIPTSISGATISPLKIGYRTFNDYQLAKAIEDYVDIDCGSLNIKEAFGNFLDYNCQVEIFLPFIGFVPLANEYWNNSTIQVHYRFNIIDGSFQARLVATRDNDGKECVLKNSVIGQYGGVCCVHYPITGLQYSNVVSGLVNGSASAITKGMGGNYAGVATDLMNMASLKPDCPMSNGYNASNSFIGQRTPYLVIRYPAPQFSMKYPSEIGLPLNVTYQLSTLSGLTIIDNPRLNINCSDEEYNEIISLMKSGIIL